MIPRDKYLQRLIANRKNGFPKVITGIRRCGKSYLIKEIFQLVYTLINPNLTEGKHVLAKKDDSEVVSFVDVVLGLSREKNIDLYVSGSNSKMLSSDIVTEFRDKAVTIQVLPLSFKEYYEYRGGSKTEAIYEYMQYGGMPLAVLKDESERKEYLKSLFETTYFKDIVERNKLRKSSSLEELCNILSEGTGTLLNAERISNTFQSVKHEKLEAQTVEKYIGYFMDAFILKEARRFDLKGRAEIGALRKYYFTDTGLRDARLDFAFPDEVQMLENIVYNELIYNGYTVNVGTFDSIQKNGQGKSIRTSSEVDFFARKENRQYYIQVTADISNAKARTRELRPYLMLNDQIQKIVVVNKPINESLDDNGFTVIGVSDFLLRFIV